MSENETVDCPALHELAQDYPIRFAKRVPKTIVMRQTVVPDLGWLLKGDDRRIVAIQDCIYKAWTNSHGAVAAVMNNGKMLGVKPDEFQVDSWHRPKERA